MTFNIRMGVSEVNHFWEELKSKVKSNKANKDEVKLYKRIRNALRHLAADPSYNGLGTHPIDLLSAILKQKVWCSYLNNKTPSAGRIYWVYGPARNEITIFAISKHPDDTEHGYTSLLGAGAWSLFHK